MKELLRDFTHNNIEIREEQQQKKEIKLLGRQRKVPGLILWEYNERTKLLIEAKYKKEDLVISSLSLSPEDITKSNKVVVNENCVYIQALNFRNAKKKLKKMGHTEIKSDL